MPYKVTRNTGEEKIYLDVLDGEPAPENEEERTFVRIRHATGNDELRVEQYANGSTFTYMMEGVGLVREESHPPTYLRRAARVWCVMTECNILDEDDKPLFVKGMGWDDFLAKWSLLEPVARDAIYAAVIRVNPSWGVPTFGGLG